ncbi:MAG: hypothetical protein JOS17DRAFT_395945 [Linnemannia elongata]|nr:MAG: hypothetical protein JOS17DRAFT_395945 [Linnemannia elongata]
MTERRNPAVCVCMSSCPSEGKEEEAEETYVRVDVHTEAHVVPCPCIFLVLPFFPPVYLSLPFFLFLSFAFLLFLLSSLLSPLFLSPLLSHSCNPFTLDSFTANNQQTLFFFLVTHFHAPLLAGLSPTRSSFIHPHFCTLCSTYPFFLPHLPFLHSFNTYTPKESLSHSLFVDQPFFTFLFLTLINTLHTPVFHFVLDATSTRPVSHFSFSTLFFIRPPLRQRQPP